MRSEFLLAIVLLLALPACTGAAPLPPKALALNRAGVEALQHGDLETADARFSLALEYNPHFVEALTNMGLVEMQRGNFDRARELLKRARKLNPDIAQPHHGLGVLAEREHRPDVAEKHYRAALSVDPGFAPSRANLARLLFRTGRIERARIQFKRLVEVAPEDPAGYEGLAESLLRLGRFRESEQITEKASGLFPGSAEICILSARAKLRHGHAGEALEMLSPLADSHDDTAVAALGWIATAELALGHPERAARTAERALRLEPGDPVSVYALAMALHALRDPGAHAWLVRAQRLSPDNPEITRALAGERASGGAATSAE